MFLFVKNPRIILTKRKLLEKLWDIDGDFVDAHTLTTIISRIRKKIETDERKYLKTAYGGILGLDNSDQMLPRYDYTPQIGDVLRLKTYGGQDVDVTVMGIVKEGSPGATGVFASIWILPEETLRMLYPGIENFQIAWNVHTDQDREVLRTLLFETAEAPALTIIARSDLTNAEIRGSERGTSIDLQKRRSSFR